MAMTGDRHSGTRGRDGSNRTSIRRRRALATMGAAAWLLTTAACAPVAGPTLAASAERRAQPTSRPAPVRVVESTCVPGLRPQGFFPGGSLPLRGDPHFDPDRLPSAERYWYDELWNSLADPDIVAYSTSLASRDDLYSYGRTLSTRMGALLTAFRVTGDLAILDEVDRLAEHMRSQLRDGWRSTRDGSNGTRDGYLNWVQRHGSSRTHSGKDLNEFDEMRTHALVAEFAWAFHNNRDLVSPDGVDYGERADVWTEYLTRHFEAKWRERRGLPQLAFPFLAHWSLHATVAFIRYHHYLGAILDSTGHAGEARRLTDQVLDRFVVARAGSDEAFVWPSRIDRDDDDDNYLQPSTYGRYVIGDAIALYLDGAYRWRDPGMAERFAATVREFVMGGAGPDAVFSRDVGGGIARSGIPASDPNGWSAPSASQYADSLFALTARWDGTGAIAARTCEMHERGSGRSPGVHLPAAMLLALASTAPPDR